MLHKKISKLKIIIFSIVLVVLVAGGTLAFGILHRPAVADKVTTGPSFGFDADKAPGWYAANPIGWDGKPSDPTAMRVFGQGTADHPVGNCFVMFSYYANSTADPATTLQQAISSTTIEFQPINALSYTMTTPDGNQSYELHQYNLVGDEDSQMERGNEFSFFKSGSGYIGVRGYCATSEDLAMMAPVFSAVSFKL